ncbi:MAG TPA: aminotransferase class V-fold PLP-dependent enzyme, partial [Deltaproteobacteria bacterium]|nr:aminotransferase class V-fold PLP-dependent enzyme [Deltaproteobacteria bacterium]
VNGTPVTHTLLDPGWTNYRLTCPYDTYDVTPLLRRGANALALMLGNGMYNVPGGRYVKFTGSFGEPKAIAELAHDKGALVHTDAVQAVGKIPVDVKELGVDFLTLSAHKIYGPKGVGAVYVKRSAPFCPLIRGGHQEKGRRAGTENTLGIVGLGKAVEMRAAEMEAEAKRLVRMKERLRKGIEETIPDIRFIGHPVDSLPGTLNVSFDGAEGEAIILYLDLEGIAVSTGSACASGSLDPSHVILATGLPAECAHGSIRISLGRENTEEDISYMLDRLPKVIGRIRDMSTAYSRRA